MRRSIAAFSAAALLAAGFGAQSALSSTDVPPSHIFVRAGEGWLAVAKRCGSTVEAIKATNPAQAKLVTLYVGEALWCPEASVPATTVTVPASTTSASTTTTTTATTTTTVLPPPGGGPLPTIPSNFNVETGLRPGTSNAASTANEPSGNFRTICNFSHLAYDDPIVYPGRPGASHLHMFFGNTLADANSTYESLRTTGEGTCQGGKLNRSAYWAPAVIDSAGQAIVPDFAAIYYKGFGTQASIRSIKPFPNGLRMIAGYNMAAPGGATHYDWNCELTERKQQTIPTCPPGERVGVVIHFPNCWDGANLDSADHRAHMSYSVGHDFSGVCPSTHPVQLPQYTLGIWFPADVNSAQWHLDSDWMPGMTHANGSTFHADWFGAWDSNVQDTYTRLCINEMQGCQDGQLGNGRQLIAAPAYTGPKRLQLPARA